ASEPTGEGDANTDTAGDGSAETFANTVSDPVVADGRSDLTIDFGFYPALRLGSKVFIDDGVDSGAPGGYDPALEDDGIMNGTETGVEDVIVELWEDHPTNGTQGVLDLADLWTN